MSAKIIGDADLTIFFVLNAAHIHDGRVARHDERNDQGRDQGFRKGKTSTATPAATLQANLHSNSRLRASVPKAQHTPAPASAVLGRLVVLGPVSYPS